MNEQDKASKLKSLSNEVKEFHPLLKALLPRLPQINRIDYTHGQTEFGADFVLEKVDATISETTYIGIVAKVGNINQSEVSSINQQVGECFDVDRFFLGSKERIRISEVWLVSNANISANAKTKISIAHAKANTAVINGDRLLHLIDKHFEEFWTALPVEKSALLSDIRKSIEAEDQTTSLIPGCGANFYVAPDIYESSPDDTLDKKKKKAKSEKPCDIFEIIASGTDVFIEGDSGSGKSKLIRNLVCKLCEPEIFSQHKIVPIKIVFRELIEQLQQHTFEEVIANHLALYSKKSMEEEEVRFCIFIDAIDEFLEASDKVDEQIGNLMKFVGALPNTQVVLSSRFLDRSKLIDFKDYNLKSYEIRPLSTGKIIAFLESLIKKGDTSSRIIKDLQKNQVFKQIPRSPIAAILLAKIINEDPRDLPSTLPELYTKFIEITTGRWEIDKNLESQTEYEALTSILENIAEYMQLNGLDEISIDEAQDYFRDYLSKRNLKINEDEFIKKSLNRCALTSLNNRKYTFRFRHRTFLEYYYASKMLKSKGVMFDQKIFEPYWSRVIYFYLGIQKDCPDDLEKIYAVDATSEHEKWMRVGMFSDYLLSAYQTPYETIEKGVMLISKDIIEIYNENIEKKSGLMTKMSPMQLLWLLQFYVKGHYSYKFFTKALETVALELSQTHNNNELAFLYFIYDQILTSIEEAPTFRFLETFDINEIPLLISIGVMASNDQATEEKKKKLAPPKKRKNATKKSASQLAKQLPGKRIKFVRNIDQKLKKQVKGSGKLTSHINQLFEKPIKEN